MFVEGHAAASGIAAGLGVVKGVRKEAGPGADLGVR